MILFPSSRKLYCFFILIVFLSFFLSCKKKNRQIVESNKQIHFDDSEIKNSNIFEFENNELDKEITFTVANGSDIPSIDPSKVSIKNVAAERVFQSLFEGIIHYDPLYSNPILGLAKEMPSISSDGLVYTINLKDNLRWSDGHPLTAHDFVYGWKKILNPINNTPNMTSLYLIEGAKEFHEGKISQDKIHIKALNNYSFEFKLKNPAPYFFNIMGHRTFYPYPKHIIEKYGDDWTKIENYVSNGPFKIKKWEKYYIELEKNPYYYDTKNVKIDRVIYYSIDDNEILYNMFKQGKIDWNAGYYPQSKVKELFEREDVHLVQTYANNFYLFNTNKPPFNNLFVRKAFSLVINTYDLTSQVLQNGSKAVKTCVPPARGIGYVPISKGKNKHFNIHKAKKFLEEAGYPNGYGFPQVTLLHDSENESRIVAEWSKKQWKKYLNINVILQSEKSQTFNNIRKDNNFNIVNFGWNADFKDPITFLELFVSNHLMNYSQYKNPIYDSIIENSINMQDQSKRFQILRQAEEILLSDYPLIPLYIPSKIHLINTNKWNGWNSNALDIHLIKFISVKNNDSQKQYE